MNSIMENYYPVFEMYQALREQLMEILTDEELVFRPRGVNPPLGALCREIGEIEYAYIQSFKTFTIDFSYRKDEPELEASVVRLKEWYQELDEALKTAVSNLSEDDIQNKRIDRGDNFKLPPRIHLDVYKEALLIFYGKASVYLKEMQKPLPPQWQQWIG